MDAWRGRGGRGSRGGTGRGRGGRRGGRRGGGTSGRGGDRTPRNQPELKLGFRELQALETKTSDEVILHLTSSRCFPATEYLLKQQSEMEDHWIVLIVSIVTKACDCSSKEDLLKLLNVLLGSSFLNLQLRPYLNKLSVNSLPPSDVTVFLRNVVRIMNELLRRFPNCCADLPLPDLYCGTKTLSDRGQLADDALFTKADELMKLRSEKAEQLRRKEEEEREKRRKPRRDEMNDDVDPPNNFRWLSVVPTQDDILQEGRPFLRRNKIEGSYNNAEHYLDVQFRLLREDFVRPLREGIAQLLERMGSTRFGALQSLQDIRVYSNVRLLYPVCTSNGLRYRIEFDNSKLRNVRWENSKRLIFGSLICLSKDKFNSLVLATVADRKLWDISRGLLDIQVIRLYDQARLEEGDVYQMVETTAFFEAYRYVLEGLKETDPAELPFQKYIVNCQKEVDPPAYVNEQGTFDLTPIMKNARWTTTASSATSLRKLRLQRSLGLGIRDAVGKGTNIPLLNLALWPSAEDLGLDDSQFKALQMALTKEFAVIQGPPGTGKTYIGLKIANVLLHNKEKWDSSRAFRLNTYRFGQRVSSGYGPILVVCYTNHALDQFLEGIHQFHPEGIVRVGGRSQSETMKECSLSELKHKMYQDEKVPEDIRSAIRIARTKMDNTQSKVDNASYWLRRCREDVLDEDELLNYAGSMTAVHYESLKQPFVEIAENNESCIIHWLQLSMNLANPNQGGGENTGAEAGREEEETEKEDDDNNQNPDVRYEADVIQDQRILDDDDGDDDVDDGHSSKPTMKKEELEVVDPPPVSRESEDGWKIQNAYRLRKKIKRITIREVSKKDVMPDERAKMVTDVWSLSLEDRWSLYRRWLMDVRQHYRRTISDYQYEFNWDVTRLKEEKEKLDLTILIGSDVIGMTTTGAAKYRKLLQQLRPQITIVEEAAEVLESHIVTSLTPGCQHLILIGDHQQLRPNPTVYELAKHYNLDVSLFERMVKNGVPFTRLRLQHRMRPEISKMLEHIYFDPKLENHKSVLQFDHIKGVARNVFFVDHEEIEDFTQEGKSRSNEHEAKFMAALCRYFIQQGYEREQITVLTAYVGQLTQLKKELVPTDFFSGVRVCAVDNFQGEENDIILLSLVRSNEEGKIGFLQIENRVCVALSRAKEGFFCIGNISLLEAKSTLWSKIIKDMRERGNVGKALMLTCQNHPQNVSHASCAKDFKTCAPEGGCTVPCVKPLKCGHVCEMLCHPTDPEHEDYDCKKPCTKSKTLCPLIQKYSGKYYQACGPCMKIFRENHLQDGPCYICKNQSTSMCLRVCLKTWPCGHEHETECHVDPLLTPCKAPCGVTLKCGHPCAGDCSRCWRGRVHEPCEAKCDRTLFCGHKCKGRCNETCPPCKEYCSNYCRHRKCQKKCGDPCDPCNEICTWQCQHYRCTKLCGELCDRPRCNMPCTKVLWLRHPCIGLCGELVWPKKYRVCHKQEVTESFFGTEGEPNARFVELADCGHVFEVEMMDKWMDQAEATPDGKPVDVQLKHCPKCRVPIRTSLRYGNIIKKILADLERIKQKILLGKGRHDQEIARLRLKVQEIDGFPRDKNLITRILDRKNLADEQINVIENQISLLSFLQALKADIAYFEADERSQETKEDLESKVEQLRKRVIWLRFQCSDQLVEELGEEMYRTQLLIEFRMLKMQLDIRGIKLGVTDTVKVDFVKEAFDSENIIDKKRRERYRARIERIRREQGLQELNQAVTREPEKDLTVKAMGLTQLQGHWFKCPSGHIYCITECGGAMEESKCPECDSRISGHKS